MYIVQNKDGVLCLATGKRWKQGQRIGENELRPRRWREALIAEGVIVSEDEALELEPQPQPRFDDLLLLEGMTPERKQALSDLGIDTFEQLASAPNTTLIQVKGVGPATIKRWKEAVKNDPA